MRAGTRFEPNPLVAEELEHSLGVGHVTKAKAEAVAAFAKATAPVLTGTFRDSIKVVEAGTGYAVVADEPTAAFKEFGTSATPPHATLRHAIEASEKL